MLSSALLSFVKENIISSFLSNLMSDFLEESLIIHNEVIDDDVFESRPG
jgi:hypothetical protein